MSFADHWFSFPFLNFLDKSGRRVENKFSQLKRHWSEGDYWTEHNRNKYIESLKVVVGGIGCLVGLAVYFFPTPFPLGLLLDVALTVVGWIGYGLLSCLGCIRETTPVQAFTPPGSDSDDDGEIGNFPHLVMLGQIILNILQNNDDTEPGTEMSPMDSDLDSQDERSPLGQPL